MAKQNEEKESLGESENKLQMIDRSTTFFQIHRVDEKLNMKISIYKFASKFYQHYEPQDGHGYFHATGEDLKGIQRHKKVILMDEVKCLEIYQSMRI